jgi:hypothetical protein
MKKIILGIILIGIFSVIFFNKKVEKQLTIEYLEKGEVIRVVDEKERIVMEYNIEDFRSFAKENWEIFFSTPPSFGELRKVDPNNFYVFGNSASISPKFNFLAFSVNDYAALTDISFLGIIDLRTNDVDLIRDYNIGGVQSIVWSPDEKYFSYILDTARAGGDYLSLDNIYEKKKVFTLSSKDIIEVQDGNMSEFLPEFRSLVWEDNSSRINFVTNSYQDEEEIFWSINNKGEDLKNERF